ncbi:MAG: hypothetical protein IJU76_13080 [Desulfovibrionaceae bacterium]|nr:hypothetical protein [Desulfovibrionaceae bacterium]
MGTVPGADMLLPFVPVMSCLFEDKNPVAIDGEVKTDLPFEKHSFWTDAQCAQGSLEGVHC